MEEPYKSMAATESGSNSTKNSLFGKALSGQHQVQNQGANS